MKKSFLYIPLFVFCACSGSEDTIIPDVPDHGEPISFSISAQLEDELTTRANTTPLNQDFVVFGFKSVPESTPQKVFDGYNVKYVGKDMTDITPYSYVGGTSISDVPQEQKYWDYSADEYRFWGVTGVFHSVNDSAFWFDVDLSDMSDLPMFSEQNVLKSEDFGKIVRMSFLRPYCMVRYSFICSDKIKPEELMVKDDRFEPVSASDRIYTSGKITVNYSLVDDIAYSVNTVGGNTLSAITPSSEVYTMVMPAPARQSAFKMTANILGEDRVAIVPSQYMKWMPNTKYTYIFKITDNSISFYDVQIDSWNFGGSQEEEWKNW